MQTDVKILRLGDMIFNRQGTFFRRVIHAVVSIAVRLFFRRIETVNAAEVPYQGALIFVMNHPNGLIDPALVFVALPRKVSFLAKSTLFKTPGLSYLLRVIEALPVYRTSEISRLRRFNQTFSIISAWLITSKEISNVRSKPSKIAKKFPKTPICSLRQNIGFI